MTIEVKKIETGYAVKFPFELKDNFKSVFKTAKWNPILKQWEVGPRSYKKLVEWTEIAEQVDEELMRAKEQEETDADLFSAKAELETIKNSIVAKQKTQAEWQSTLDELAQYRLEIEKAKAERVAAENEILKTRAQVQQFLDGVIDFKRIQEAKTQMSYLHRKVGERSKFDAQQDIILDELKKLRNVGFNSPALQYLASLNYNRPDRDKIADCPDMLVIHPYSKDE
ncbi:DUF2333 family protein [Acinetobacter baumannii]|uniref:DUF2333 family protein n=1 Tax=Acinetobacter baumannii TaxID=470 RepID=UPI0013B79483|nr:DUF2333 family protein [Acinetobacter baumannii]NDX19750.1 DUF2333 family protein [Acinetobacter baumannii]NDX35279.1 DUF2333 family protein [Acinetobacter baumannii]